MDKIEFALFIAKLSKLGATFTEDDIVEVNTVISRANNCSNVKLINSMLRAIFNGQRIDAVKYYRSLTGATLKDSIAAIPTTINKGYVE